MSLESEIKNLTEMAVAGAGIDPNLKPYQKGHVPWNKGLTKENDPRLARAGENRKVSSMIDRKVNKLFNDQQAILDQHSRILDKIDRFVTNAQLNQRYERDDDERPARYASRRRQRDNGYREKVDKPLSVNEEILKQKYPEVYDKVINRTYEVKDKGLREKYPDIYAKRKPTKSYSSYSANAGGGIFSSLFQGAVDIGLAGIGLAPFNQMFGLSSKLTRGAGESITILKEIRDKLKSKDDKKEKEYGGGSWLGAAGSAIGGLFGGGLGGLGGLFGAGKGIVGKLLLGIVGGVAAKIAIDKYNENFVRPGGIEKPWTPWDFFKGQFSLFNQPREELTEERLKELREKRTFGEMGKDLGVNTWGEKWCREPVAGAEKLAGKLDFGNIGAIAKITGVPEEHLATLIAAESRGDPNAKSDAGAIGLGQIMPVTGRSLLRKYTNIAPSQYANKQDLENLLKNPDLNAYLTGMNLKENYNNIGRFYKPDARIAFLSSMVGPEKAKRFLDYYYSSPDANVSRTLPGLGNEEVFGKGSFKDVWARIDKRTNEARQIAQNWGVGIAPQQTSTELAQVTKPKEVTLVDGRPSSWYSEAPTQSPEAVNSNPDMDRSGNIEDASTLLLKVLTQM